MGVMGVAGVVAEPCDPGEEEGDGDEEEERGDVGDAPSAREPSGDDIVAASVVLMGTAKRCVYSCFGFFFCFTCFGVLQVVLFQDQKSPYSCSFLAATGLRRTLNNAVSGS
jgi:hypothetical protein